MGLHNLENHRPKPNTERYTTPRSSGFTWDAFTSADIDRDGKSDLFFKYESGLTATWAMTTSSDPEAGATIKRTSDTIKNESNQDCYITGTWKPVGSADFDRDGYPDLLFQDSYGSLVVWFLYWDGTCARLRTPVTPLSPSGSGADWRAVGTGDFNRDGSPDILFQNDGTGVYPSWRSALAVWYMGGANGLQCSSTAVVDPLSPTDLNYWVAGTGDWNDDYRVDILFQNKVAPNGGDLWMWFMDGVDKVSATAISDANVLNPDLPPELQYLWPTPIQSSNVIGPR